MKPVRLRDRWTPTILETNLWFYHEWFTHFYRSPRDLLKFHAGDLAARFRLQEKLE